MEKINLTTATEQNMVNNAVIAETKAPQTSTRRRRSNAPHLECHRTGTSCL